MSQVIVTLVYPDSTQWIAGAFPDAPTAAAWATAQNLDPSITVNTVTIPDVPPVPTS